MFNNVASDQLAPEKPADLKLQCLTKLSMVISDKLVVCLESLVSEFHYYYFLIL